MTKQHEALSRPPGKSFLDLPDHIRRQIYHYARARFYGRLVLGHFRYRHQAVYNLLQTSRGVYTDIQSSMFLENNVIVPSANIETGLLLLTRLTPHICSGLQDLSVHLYVPNPSDNWDMYQSRRQYYVPPVPLTPGLIQLWQTAVGHILTHSKPGTLVLRLICDSGDSKETIAVLKPFFDFPGSLRDCEIRLFRKKINQVSTLAAKAVASATGRYLPCLQTQPFPYLQLPIEIRRRVLEYTDLVAPRREIFWNHETGFYIYSDICRCRKYEGVRIAEIETDHYDHYPCQFEACFGTQKGYETQAACHKVDSGFAFGCSCWLHPQYLMLVCRSFYADALATLYEQNLIIVTPAEQLMEKGGINSDALQLRLHESRFLTRNVVPDALYHLRSIEIIFPPFKQGFDRANPSDHAICDWNFAVQHLAKHANLPNLTIAFYMTLGNPKYHVTTMGLRGCLDLHFRRRRRKHDGNEDALLKTHRLLLQPFREGRQPKRLFIFLEYLWHWSGKQDEYGPVDEIDRLTHIYRKVTEMEKRLEVSVMGDEYNSDVMGKSEWSPNKWIYQLWLRQQPYIDN